jgi:putative glutathione S-transferase
VGMLVDGKWQDVWYDTASSGGRFMRKESAFRDRISADGSTGFPAALDRYHLYVSLACPWAHRTLVFRALKRLEKAIPVSVVHPLMLENGWEFREYPGATGDPLLGSDYLHQVYTRAKPDYTGRVTVPALWDKQTGTIVNNESAEIIRMFNTAFDGLEGVGNPELDLYPEDLRDEIDTLNARVYDAVNNGVYKCGFATTQEAYDEAFEALFAELDGLEARLEGRRWLFGERQTEADWRLFTTLVRFDPVYVGHFKCNLRRIADYPNLARYLKDLCAIPGVAATLDIDHIKRHYYGSHRSINPTGIVPRGPEDFGWGLTGCGCFAI